MMVRNCAPRPWRTALATASWLAAAGVVQALLGPQVAAAARGVEDRIELRIRRAPEPAPADEPRSHEDEPFEPWELVGV